MTWATPASELSGNGGTRRWRRIRAIILSRDRFQCQVPLPDGRLCLEPATVCGHILARIDGGDDHPSNLRAECLHHSTSGGGQIAMQRSRNPHAWRYSTPQPLVGMPLSMAVASRPKPPKRPRWFLV